MGLITTTAERPATDRQMEVLRAYERFGTCAAAGRHLGIGGEAVRQALVVLRIKKVFPSAEGEKE